MDTVLGPEPLDAFTGDQKHEAYVVLSATGISIMKAALVHGIPWHSIMDETSLSPTVGRSKEHHPK